MSAIAHKRGQIRWPPNRVIFESDLTEEDAGVFQYGIAMWSYDLLRSEMIPPLYEAIWDALFWAMPRERTG